MTVEEVISMAKQGQLKCLPQGDKRSESEITPEEFFKYIIAKYGGRFPKGDEPKCGFRWFEGKQSGSHLIVSTPFGELFFDHIKFKEDES